MSSKNASPARGTKDILPNEARLRSWAVGKILETYSRHGFTQIETPIIENVEWLTGGIGGENEKLLFKILKRGEKLDLSKVKVEEDLFDLALRFDLTVPLTRYYANNQSQLAIPFKSIQMGPVFRAERPQKGRFRQFMQCDIDILGEESPLGEIELIGASTEALQALSLTGFELRINDRGALNAIARYCGIAQEAYQDFFITLDKLDKIAIQGVSDELKDKGFAPSSISGIVSILESLKLGEDPLEIYSKVGVEQEIISNLEMMSKFTSGISQGNFSVSLDPTIVRGMGYYTGTVFEVTIPGWNSSIAGGGRYDRMLERYGKGSPAVGFSLGFERIISILLEKDNLIRETGQKNITVLFSREDDINAVYDLSTKYRADGYNVSIRYLKNKVGNQLKRLESEANSMRRPGDFFGVIFFGQDGEIREL